MSRDFLKNLGKSSSLDLPRTYFQEDIRLTTSTLVNTKKSREIGAGLTPIFNRIHRFQRKHEKEINRRDSRVSRGKLTTEDTEKEYLPQMNTDIFARLPKGNPRGNLIFSPNVRLLQSST